MNDKNNGRGLSLMNRVRLEQQAKVVQGDGKKEGRRIVGRIDPFMDLKDRIHEEIIQEIDPAILDSKDNADIVKQTVQNMIIDKLASEETPLSRADRETILQDLMDEVLGYGPIQTLLDDDNVTEVMVNGPAQVYAERKGKITLTDKVFHDNNHVLRIIEKIVAPLGRRIDESTPMVDARLAGRQPRKRHHPAAEPCGADAHDSEIQPRPVHRRGPDRDWYAYDRTWLISSRHAFKREVNIVVSGGTGSGKTTMLNILSSFIPDYRPHS